MIRKGKKLILKKATQDVEEVQEQDLDLLMTGVDIQNRTIEIRAEVNEVMASIVSRALLTMASISNEDIYIYLSSPGGSVYDGLAIYDFIRICPCDVHIIASGPIMSMGFIIFLAGDTRRALPNTTFMMHSLSYSPGETPKIVRNHEVDVIEGKRVNNILMDIMAQRTKQAKKYWYRKILHTDFYLGVEEAKQLGVIYTPEPIKKSKKVKNVRKKV